MLIQDHYNITLEINILLADLYMSKLPDYKDAIYNELEEQLLRLVEFELGHKYQDRFLMNLLI